MIFVGIGGAFGALARFQLGKILSGKAHTAFPFGTFWINLSGALLLGVLTSMDTGSSVYRLLGDGFLGAYTTFSTFMYEGITLIQGNEKRNALLYLVASLILGMLGYFAGFELGNAFM